MTGGVLLASESRRIPAAAVRRAVELAAPDRAPVHVLSVARVWGTSFGLPSPGLLPTRAEWDEQRAVVDGAVRALGDSGVEARGSVIGTRVAAKRIASEARRLGCDAIVMGADPPRSRWLRNFIWSQEPYRVERRAGVPVHLVVES